MKLYNYVECDSGALHWAIAKTEKLARIAVLDYANTPYEKTDEEYIISEELELLDGIEADTEFTFFKDTHNPITHTKQEWEEIYRMVDQPVLYLACSEY